jgi:hypothetical protein
VKRLVAFDDRCIAEGQEDVPADVTRTFSVDGTEYVTDLTAAHSAEFDAAIAPWIDAVIAVRKLKERARTGVKPGPKPGQQLGFTQEFYQALQVHLDGKGIPYREQGSKQNRYPREEKLRFKEEWDRTHGVGGD